MILNIINQIAQESSTNNKEEILRINSDNELLKRVCYLAESPRVKFYIKQLPEPSGIGDLELSEALKRLDYLSSREYTGQQAFKWLEVTLNDLSLNNQEVLRRVVLKDLRMNCGTKIMNKVWKNLIETTPYQGAVPFSRKDVDKLLLEGAVYSQLKMDGCYSNAIIFNGSVEFVSRQGEVQSIEIKGFDKLPNGVLNGELTLKNIPNRAQANGIIRSIIDIESKRDSRTEVETNKKIANFEKKNGMSLEESKKLVVYTAWDYLTLDEYYSKKSDRPYYKRLDELSSLGVDLVPTKVLSSFKEIMEHYLEVVKESMEGIIVKSMYASWKDGKPKHCIKIKEEINFDLKIVGYNYGTGKNSEVISSIKVESSDGLLKTVPTGMTEAEMKDFTENQETYSGKILEVKCSGLSQDKDGNYSTLHPVVVGLRTDKKEANTLQECLDIVEASRNI